MALQKIGLEAVLDMRTFNRAFRQYMSRLDQMNNKTSSTARTLSNQFLGLGNSLLKIGAILSGAVLAGVTAVGIGLGALAVKGINEAADLEQGIANIAAVMNITSEEAGFLKDVIIDLGLDPRLKVTTFEAAEAVEILAKNGIFAGLSLEEMEEVARGASTATVLLANATGAEFGQAADIATDAMILFNQEADDMVDIVSGITAVTTNSKFTIDDYELALRNGGAAAAQMGVSLNDFNVAIAASAEELGKGRKAGTGMLNFINRLTPNSKKATGVMEDLGLIVDGNNVFFDEATGELKGMDEISRILNETLYGTQAVITEVGGRTAEQNAALSQMQAEYAKAEQTIFDYTQGAKAFTASEEERTKAIEEANATMINLYEPMEALNAVQGELVVTNSHLTDEMRSMALETIFGNDGMKTAIALGKEGALVGMTQAEVMETFGVSMHKANEMIAEGITQWDVLNAQMAETDAVVNAETRMDTLRGKIEILGGVFEAIRIKIGDAFLPMLTELAVKLQEWIDKNPTLIDDIGAVAEKVAELVEALITGQPPLQALIDFLDGIGAADIGDKLQQFANDFNAFLEPIVAFINEHKDQIISGLKAIGAVFASSMIAAVIMGIVSAIGALLSPLGLLIAAVVGLKIAWDENFLGIQDAVIALGAKVKPVFDEIVTAVQGFVEILQSDGAAAQFEEVFRTIETVISVVQPILETFISSIRDSLIATFQNAANSGADFAPVLERLKELWVTLQPIVQTLAQVIGVILVGQLAAAAGMFRGLSEAIAPFLRTLALVLEGVVQFVQGVIDFLLGLGTWIAGFITDNEEMMVGGYAQMKDGVLNIILGLVQTIVSLLLGMFETIKALLSGFVQGFHRLLPRNL